MSFSTSVIKWNDLLDEDPTGLERVNACSLILEAENMFS